MSNKICGLKNISVVVQFQFCYLVIRTWITQLTKLVIYRIETCNKVNPLISGFVKIQIADSSDYLDSPFSSYGFLLFFPVLVITGIVQFQACCLVIQTRITELTKLVIFRIQISNELNPCLDLWKSKLMNIIWLFEWYLFQLWFSLIFQFV